MERIIKNNWGDELRQYDLPSNPNGKINLGIQTTFYSHRSGWKYAVDALKPLHNDSGIVFDGFLENFFLWKTDFALNHRIVPYKNRWCGIIHNPHNMQKWFNYKASPQNLISSKNFQDSLDTCVGLFALSEYHAKYLRQATGKPVSVLFHPTEIPEKQFNLNAFFDNKQKRIINIGYWQRKLTSIFLLPTDDGVYRRTRITPFEKDSEPDKNIWDYMKMEIEHVLNHDLSSEQADAMNRVELLNAIPNDEYDELLSKNICFLDLYDSSANNAVIECIARATPILVNPIDAVVEYLGEGYPLYFNSLEEAAKKAMNVNLIIMAHEYLKTYGGREKLTQEYFRRSFEESEVYKLI